MGSDLYGRAGEPIADHNRQAAFRRHLLPIRPEEGATVDGRGIRRADPDRAGVEPFRQLVGERRGREAVAAADDDDRALLFRDQAALGGQEAKMEGGAGSLECATGRHRGHYAGRHRGWEA
ncbi:MAG: hypothetical protein RI910_2551 [Verrucomicrobiota bacterium]